MHSSDPTEFQKRPASPPWSPPPPPTQTYQQPPSAYHQPPPAYHQQPPPAYHQPPPPYHQQPSPAYQQPPAAYHQQPSPAYQQPPAAYHQQPSPAYQQQQQPVTGIPVTDQNTTTKPPSLWSTGLCDCCDDVSNCWQTVCCPCVTFGQIAEIIDGGSIPCGATGVLYTLICLVTGCCCIYSCYYRTKMRNKYSLRGSCCGDFMVHFCCDCCALCQEYRELTNRGFNVPLGWHGNVQNNPGLAMAAPVVQGGMQR